MSRAPLASPAPPRLLLRWWDRVSLLRRASLPVLLAACLPPLGAGANDAVHPFDPSRMMGVESCAECHDAIVDAWEETVHALSFVDLHERALAEDIAGLLGIRSHEIRQHQSCVRCHYTPEEIHSVIQVNHAVSCETCHGASADWIDVHNRGRLSRAERKRQCEEEGMIHPGNVYATGKRCFECHVVDSEPLVNVAGHPAFSRGFELYSWSMGQMRHNYLVERPGKPTRQSSSTLQPVSASRKRMLFLTGKLIHTSATLSALSRAEDPPVDVEGNYLVLADGNHTYAVQLARQIHSLRRDLEQLQRLVPNESYAAALETLQGLKLVTGNQERIRAAAEEIDHRARTFAETHTGEEFAAIDPIFALLTMR